LKRLWILHTGKILSVLSNLKYTISIQVRDNPYLRINEIKRAHIVLSDWKKPVLILFSDKDPFFSRYYQFFDSLIPDSAYKKKVRIKNAGHYLQEDKGREIAHYIAQFAGKY
jgi:pimeloyl-ACP methyl ester carboxylesterase